MKKIIGLILASIMCIFSSVTVFADTTENIFPMMTNTGIINLKGQTTINTLITPNAISDDSIIVHTTGVIPNITSLKLVIYGERNGWFTSNNFEYDFTNYTDINATVKGQGDYWKLNIYSEIAPLSGLLVTSFNKIYSISLVATGYFETESYQVYSDWGTVLKDTDEVSAFEIVKNFENNSNFTDAVSNIIPALTKFEYVSKNVRNDYPFLVNTDINNDRIVTRQEVIILSYSELGESKGIKGFEGLTSQVVEFFNKKTNGTITFAITTAPATLSNVWLNGGIPSTELGFKNPNKNITNNIMGLFFNYETTGSLVSLATIEDDGTVTFDISENLNDIGSNTHIIKSIYYGLVGGLNYTNVDKTGLKIEKVILSYEDNIKVEESTEKDAEEIVEIEDTTVDIEEEDNDNTVDEVVDDAEDDLLDDADAEIVEDTDAEIVDNDNNVKNDTKDSTIIDEDVNPPTGTMIALTPMVISLAIGIFVKKRK